jgi:hypothetical protein
VLLSSLSFSQAYPSLERHFAMQPHIKEKYTDSFTGSFTFPPMKQIGNFIATAKLKNLQGSSKSKLFEIYMSSKD